MPRVRKYNLPYLARIATQMIREDKPMLVSVDTETNGASFYAEPFCVTMTWRRPNGRLQDGYWELGDVDFAEQEVAEILAEVTGREGCLVFHNAKFDLQKLIAHDMLTASTFPPHRIHDTEAIWHLLYPNDRKSLDHLTAHHLADHKSVEVPITSGKNKGKMRRVSKNKLAMKEALKRNGLKAEDGYHLLPRYEVVPYAMADTRDTYELFELGHPKLEGGLLDTYAMEQEVTFALLDMERAGMRVDLDYLTTTTSEFGVKVMESAAQIAKLAGKDVNPNAPGQLEAALKKRGVKVDGTNKQALRKVDDDLAREILNYRYLTKVHGDKLRPLLDEQRDGLIHPWIRQHGTKTGRSASGGAQIDG